MDITKVEQIARKHKELATTRGLGTLLETETARQREAEALNQLLREIETDCSAYCAAYNDAFGAPRVRWEAHGETVVIRSHLDQEDTLVFRRVSPSETHAGRIEAHRYHYREQPVHLPVDVRRTDDGTLMLTLGDRDVAAADVVLDLLTAFTEHIARTEAGVEAQKRFE